LFLTKKRFTMKKHADSIDAAILDRIRAGPQDRVVLLPGPEGKVGAVAVNPGGSETVLASAYASARLDAQGGIEQTTSSATQVASDFGPVLAALPPRPVSYTLYFELDSDRLTADSAAQARTGAGGEAGDLLRVHPFCLEKGVKIGRPDLGLKGPKPLIEHLAGELSEDPILPAGGNPHQSARVGHTCLGQMSNLCFG
jgi:hypothetical protein